MLAAALLSGLPPPNPQEQRDMLHIGSVILLNYSRWVVFAACVGAAVGVWMAKRWEGLPGWATVAGMTVLAAYLASQ